MLKMSDLGENFKRHCYICGDSRSVKYTIEIDDPALTVTKAPARVCVCNRCGLFYGIGAGLKPIGPN